MKLFRRRPPPADPANSVEATPALVAPAPPKQALEISLSAEQRSILEKPIDPRVDRILRGIYADKAAAERALNSRRIIDSPLGDSGERHVIQDESGFWRIIPGPAPKKAAELLDAL